MVWTLASPDNTNTYSAERFELAAGVQQNMTNIDTNVADLDRDQFAALFDEYLDQKSIREQSVVTGKGISIEGDWVTVDIGYKAEGTISRNEFLNEEGELAIEVGSNVDVYLDSMSEADGTLKLSKRRADQMKAWEDIARAHDAGETVKGTKIL